MVSKVEHKASILTSFLGYSIFDIESITKDSKKFNNDIDFSSMDYACTDSLETSVASMFNLDNVETCTISDELIIKFIISK